MHDGLTDGQTTDDDIYYLLSLELAPPAHNPRSLDRVARPRAHFLHVLFVAHAAALLCPESNACAVAGARLCCLASVSVGRSNAIGRYVGFREGCEVIHANFHSVSTGADRNPVYATFATRRFASSI